MPARRRLVIAMAIAAIVLAAALAVSAGGQPVRGDRSADQPWTTATALRDLGEAFPALAAPSERHAGRLPTGEAQVVASGIARASDGTEVAIAATDSHQLCFEMNDSGTCQPADLVLDRGMFIIATNCGADPVSAEVMGVVPAGIARAAVSGAPAVGGDRSPSGVVSFSVPDGAVPGLVLDGGRVNPLSSDPSACRARHG